MTALLELCELSRGMATGEFICAANAVEVHVYLQSGRLAWGTSSSSPLEFARYLRTHTKIDDAAFRQVVDECRKEKLPLGETLVAWGLVTWSDVRAALRHQIGHALGILAELASARTMFLHRERFQDYNAELTFELESFGPLPRTAPAPAAAVPTPAASAPANVVDDRRLVGHLLATIEGAAWVELLERQQTVEVAPATSDTPRVSSALLAASLADGADFVAIRSASGVTLGVRLQGADRSLWCALGADSTFGAAVSTLWSLSGVRPASFSLSRASTWWTVGDPASPERAEIELVLARAAEILAVMVIDGDGEPLFGVTRGIVKDDALELMRKRTRVFAVAGVAGRNAQNDTETKVFGYRSASIVTGERSAWCFGAAPFVDPRRTLWVLTDRSVSQGLGWACLAALTRGLVRLEPRGGQ